MGQTFARHAGHSEEKEGIPWQGDLTLEGHEGGLERYRSTVICSNWIRAKWLGIDKKIIPVSEKLQNPWSFRQLGCMVNAHRHRYQRRWTATVRHLICVNVRRVSLDSKDGNGDRHRNISTTVEVAWRETSTRKFWARSAACIRSLAKLSLATFWVTEPANWL